MSVPSGISELSKTGFEFISHSLLGSPLSQELGATGRGLQGGALLITGARVSLYITIIILNNTAHNTGISPFNREREHELEYLQCLWNIHCVAASSQGSGKSTLSRALCEEARKHLDAHVEVVDCKKLQGQQIVNDQTCENKLVECIYHRNLDLSFQAKEQKR